MLGSRPGVRRVPGVGIESGGGGMECENGGVRFGCVGPDSHNPTWWCTNSPTSPLIWG